MKLRIVEFISAGAKNYGLKHVSLDDEEDIKAVLKIRGFELTYNASQSITFDTMKALVQKKFGDIERLNFNKLAFDNCII